VAGGGCKAAEQESHFHLSDEHKKMPKITAKDSNHYFYLRRTRNTHGFFDLTEPIAKLLCKGRRHLERCGWRRQDAEGSSAGAVIQEYREQRLSVDSRDEVRSLLAVPAELGREA